MPIATFLTGTLSGIMLAGQKPEDQKAMLEAQKQAAANADNAAKNAVATATAMSAPPAPRASVVPVAPTFAVPPSFTPNVVMSSTGKPMPVQPPQPEL